MEKDKKPTKTEMKRARQKAALIDAAEKAIARNGLSSLKARDLADEIGIALGGIYNIVSDLDELVLLTGSRTLQELNRKLDRALETIDKNQPIERLVAAGQAYHHFAAENYYLWRALFDHRMSGEKSLPDWVTLERKQPFFRVIEPLSRLMPNAADADIAVFAQTLFSCVHGMVLIGLENHDVGVRHDQLDAEIAHLLHIIASGLQSRS